jgi:hypothetical protein
VPEQKQEKQCEPGTVCDAWRLTAGRMVQRNLGNSDSSLIVFGIRLKMKVKQVNFEVAIFNRMQKLFRTGYDLTEEK